jgi:uncharacterized membrane protein
MTFHLLLVAVAAGLNGLLAGLYFAFAVAVMPGLARTDDRTFVATMAWINERIVNGWFLTVFLGAPLLAVIAAVRALVVGEPGSGWLVAAALLALCAVLSTGRLNVPLNNELAAAGPDGTGTGSGTGPAEVRRAFEEPWVQWNLLRTYLSIGAFGALLAALVVAVG